MTLQRFRGRGRRSGFGRTRTPKRRRVWVISEINNLQASPGVEAVRDLTADYVSAFQLQPFELTVGAMYYSLSVFGQGTATGAITRVSVGTAWISQDAFAGGQVPDPAIDNYDWYSLYSGGYRVAASTEGEPAGPPHNPIMQNFRTMRKQRDNSSVFAMIVQSDAEDILLRGMVRTLYLLP